MAIDDAIKVIYILICDVVEQDGVNPFERFYSLEEIKGEHPVLCHLFEAAMGDEFSIFYQDIFLIA